MKNFTVLLVFVLSGLMQSYAQEGLLSPKKPHYEISFDALGFSMGRGLSLSVDKLLNASESVGMQASFYSGDWGLGFHYKHFFSPNYARGFYTQIGLTNHLTNHYYYNPNQYYSKKEYTLGFDFNLGYKLVSKRNFMIDCYSGFSQNLIGNYNPSQNTRLNFHYGIRIGKRF